MAKSKKKLLPKDFDALLRAGDLVALKAVFDTCELEARGGYAKRTALAFFDCPDPLVQWLVEQGADIDARDTYGRTALHERASALQRDIRPLLDFGADVHARDTEGNTPLHAAAGSANPGAVALLLEHGARADAVNLAGLNPLAAGLQYCSNIQIAGMAKVAERLLGDAPPPKQGFGERLRNAFGTKGHLPAGVTEGMQVSVQRIGERFEFHRGGFNPDCLEETSAGLDRLYALFAVTPVPRRVLHDGRGPIVARSERWQDQHRELWEMLVPSSGAASTVQGEVIRIAGRIAEEVDRNGGVNWDAAYRKMAAAFLTHIGSGTPLPEVEVTRAAQLMAQVRSLEGAPAGLIELAAHWVRLNPRPVTLVKPDYDR